MVLVGGNERSVEYLRSEPLRQYSSVYKTISTSQSLTSIKAVIRTYGRVMLYVCHFDDGSEDLEKVLLIVYLPPENIETLAQCLDMHTALTYDLRSREDKMSSITRG